MAALKADAAEIAAADDPEGEIGRTGALLAEIVDARKAGNRDSIHGNSDSDLLGAVEECESAMRQWRRDR